MKTTLQRIAVGLLLTVPGVWLQAAESPRPNVVYILADDLGMGDLSCYGQKKLQTPNIDRLATEGMLLSNHYSGNTVCSPSRAVLMTGQHPAACTAEAMATRTVLRSTQE